MQADSYQDVYYRIVPEDSKVRFFEKENADQLYNNHERGFIRVAKAQREKKEFRGQQFKDYDFNPPSLSNIKYMRLYDIYDNDYDMSLFPPNQQSSSYIDELESYNSFLAQSGVISYKYLQTLFITQEINSAGYYRYFVKRNGEYFIEQCDDYIPIDIRTRKPIWGLSLKHPWQIMLLKAWLKETGSWQALFDAQPFRFLDAFGLPSYRTFNFKKQAEFLKQQKTSMQNRQNNINSLAINKQQVVIIAQTINSPKLWDVGLIPGVAGYRMIRVTEAKKEAYYRLYSSLPCKWVGKMTPIQKTGLNSMSVKDYFIDLERNFIITEEQALNYFGKCYVVPKDFVKSDNYVGQDCMSFSAQDEKQLWFRFQSKERSQGLLAISFEMPYSPNRNKIYPSIRYFLSKKNTNDEISKSHLRHDIRASKSKDNMYVESNCDKWQEYRIDYHQGYHHSSAFYTKLTEGEYIMYVEFTEDTEFKMRIDTSVHITRPELTYPDATLGRQIFDSTFFDVAQNIGVEASFSKKDFNETIILSDTFDEIGFGAVVITTLKDAKHKVAMRVFPDKLKASGYDFCQNFYGSLKSGQSGVQDPKKGIVLISERGKPEIIVLRRIDKSIKTMIEQSFPPKGTIEFFKVTPDGVNDKSLGKSTRKSSVRKSKKKI